MRPAPYIHKCNKCGVEIRTYRSCEGEHHAGSHERPCGGTLALVEIVEYEQAKKQNLCAKYA
jgi:hypothetical protein